MAEILVNGEQKSLKVCGLCAHRIQIRDSWESRTRGGPSGNVFYTQDLRLPIPEDTSSVVFTAITKRGQRVMEWAQRKSKNFGLEGIAATAILMALLSEERSTSYDTLRDMGVDLDKAFRVMNEALQVRSTHEALKPHDSEGMKNEILDTRDLLARAQRKAAEFGDGVVEPEHIFLALLEGKRTMATEILLLLGVNMEELEVRLLNYLEGQRMEMNMARRAPVFREMSAIDELLSEGPADAGSTVGAPVAGTSVAGTSASGTASSQRFLGNDLVQEARESTFDSSVGREDLVERMVRVLCREHRNNPLLVGESGVGKTYLVEALAQRVARGDVPPLLQEVSIAELDTVALLEGASLQGELEKRVRRLADSMASHPGGFILYIPYIQHMLGEEGRAAGMGLFTILQPITENPRLWCVATITFKHFENLIAPDENLNGFFQKIPIEELPPKSTLKLLEQLRPHYELFHHVRISDEALEAAVNLSNRYLSGMRLPDKAIDLIDEAAAQVTVEGCDGDEAEVSAEDVAEIITLATGIPLKSLVQEEADRLLHMEEELSRRVIGQERALKVVSETIRRSRAGLSDQKRPIGTFLFMGSTGVGKTEVARSLAEFLFGGEKSMIRLDMSEFSEKHSVAKLIGSPPGYIGYEEGGQLTSAVDEKPYSVVLLDEIEKAHPAIFNLLLQLMDEGRLTDSRGKTVDFRNTILIMTSNIAGEMINALPLSDESPDGGLDLESLNAIMDQVKDHFSMEFINRIDEIVVFNPLGMQQIEKIVDLKIALLRGQLENKGLSLVLDESARELLARKGYSQEFGARYLQREVQKELANPLSDLLLKGDAPRGCSIEVRAAGDALVFQALPGTG